MDDMSKEFQYYVFSSIPASKHHTSTESPGSWWGYNQSKIVRHKDTVFMLVQENDAWEEPLSTIYSKKDNEIKWKKGASVGAVRPGNICVDDRGFIHVIVPQGRNSQNVSLEYFYLLDPENIQKYDGHNSVVKKDSFSSSLTNIRIGCGMRHDGLMAVAFGQTTRKDYGKTMNIYYKSRDGHWSSRRVVGEELESDFYYPYVCMKGDGARIISVQDDDDPDSDKNIYQKLLWSKDRSGNMSSFLFHDLSGHWLAQARNRMLLADDLMIADDGYTHRIFKEYTVLVDPTTPVHYYHQDTKDGPKARSLDFSAKKIQFIRLFRFENEIFMLATSYNRAYILDYDANIIQEIKLPTNMLGIWPYIAESRGGTSQDKKYVDILLLAAGKRTYEIATNCYVRLYKNG